MLELVITSSMDVCTRCGKSKKGILAQVRYGADEGLTEVKCMCLRAEDFSTAVGLLSETCNGILVGVEYCDNNDNNSTSSSTNSNAEDDPHNCVHVDEYELTYEHEVRISGSIAKDIHTNMMGNLTTGSVYSYDMSEWGYPTTIVMTDGSSRSSRLRVREKTVKRMSTQYDITAKFEISKVQLCPLYSYHISAEVSIDMVPSMCPPISDVSQEYRVRYRELIMIYRGWLVISRHYTDSDRYSCEIEIRSDDPVPRNRDVLEVLEYMHSEYGYIDSMAREIGRDILSVVKSSYLRPIDIQVPSNDRYKYRIKADGSQRWIVDSGCLWYICQHRYPHKVLGYILKESMVQYNRTHTIIQVEQLTSGAMVYIDILCYNSSPSPPERSFVYTQSRLRALFNPPPMIIREEYDSYSQCYVSHIMDPMPSDGVIAIDKETSHVYRIKDLTIDFYCESGFLYSDTPNTGKVYSNSAIGMIDGTVYECKVSLNPEGNLFIVSWIPRRDKTAGNLTNVVDDIIYMAKSDPSFNSFCIKSVTDACFAVRSLLYQKAHASVAPGNRLVVDIGSSRMQSLSFFNKSKFSYLLCDPDLDTKAIGSTRNTIEVTDLSASSVRSTMESLNKGSYDFAFFKCRWEDICMNKTVIEFLEKQQIPIVYSFSLSFLHSAFNKLRKQGCKQIGCCYSYDSIDSQGVLIDYSGIKMKVSEYDETLAIVDFPRSQVFTEPVVTSKTFKGSRMKRATEVSDLKYYSKELLDQVIDKIIIVSSQLPL